MHPFIKPIAKRLDLILRRQDEFELFLRQLQRTIMFDLTKLQAAVAAEDTVIASAITLIEGIPALIAAAGTDPVALQALQDDITAKSSALAAAVAANTPASPAPAPAPAPVDGGTGADAGDGAPTDDAGDTTAAT